MAQIKSKGGGNMVSSETGSCPSCKSTKKGLIAAIAVFVAIILCSGIGCNNGNHGEQITIEITPKLTKAVQKYDYLGQFHEGLAYVKKDGKYGYIDGKGNEVIPCRYDDAFGFSEGLAWIMKGGLCGFINKNGEEVVPCRYDNTAFEFSEGLAAVKKGDLWGFINKNGEEVIPCRYDAAGDFSEGLANVQFGSKWGYVDKKGNSTFTKVD